MAGYGPNGGIQGVCNAACVTTGPKTTTINSTACFTRGNACSTTANLLVVAGGGGGALGQGGGGGAGGYRFCASYPLASCSAYKVTIGAGGVGAGPTSSPTSRGSKGTDSSFDTCGVGTIYPATGGGGGATGWGGNGGDGGSGGGVGEGPAVFGNGNEGGYPVVEGYNGGNNDVSPGMGSGGGGGGGLGGNVPGPWPTSPPGGPGGIGSNAWPGDSTLRAGGGAAAGSPTTGGGTGGPGGGGCGGSCPGSPAPSSIGGVNLGGGGGGDSGAGTGQNAGGKGVVIVIEPCGTKCFSAGGIWPQTAVYENIVAGTWPT